MDTTVPKLTDTQRQQTGTATYGRHRTRGRTRQAVGYQPRHAAPEPTGGQP